MRVARPDQVMCGDNWQYSGRHAIPDSRELDGHMGRAAVRPRVRQSPASGRSA